MSLDKCLLSLTVLMLVACGTIKPKMASYKDLHGTESASVNTTSECGYSDFKSKEYKLTDKSLPMVPYTFYVDLNQPSYAQSDSEIYKNLVKSNFKILSTGHKTFDSRKAYMQGKEYVVIDNEAYSYQKNIATAVILPSCEIFYLGRLGDFKWITDFIVNSDGTGIMGSDHKDFIGSNSLERVTILASSVFDEFKSATNVKTDSFNGFLIRGLVSKENVHSQLYADIDFFDDWGHLRYARDKFGNRFELNKIDTNADCGSIGCELTETVGVPLDIEYLKKYRTGFSLKLSGTKEVIIEIPSNMVEAYLTAVEGITDI